MNYIITRTLNLRVLIKALFLSPCCVEYLKLDKFNHAENIFVKTILTKFNIRLISIPMGRMKNSSDISFSKIAYSQLNIQIANTRKRYHNRCNSSFLNINNDILLNKDMARNYENLLVSLYTQSRIDNIKNDERIFSQTDQYDHTIVFRILSRLNTLVSVEFLRVLIFLFRFILKFNPYKNKNSSINIINKDCLILVSEFYPRNEFDLFKRNQFVLSENLSQGDSFLSLDFASRSLYIDDKKYPIIFGSLSVFLSILARSIPKIDKYYRVNYSIDFLSLLRFVRITYMMWSLIKNINVRKSIINYYSPEAASLTFLSNINNVPVYMFQGSMAGQINSYLHSPYSNIMCFTKLHGELYSAQSEGFKYLKSSVKTINYPYCSYLNKSKIRNFKNILERDFDLSIAYFDEAYATLSSPFSSFTFYYEDLKREIKMLLEFAISFPRVALVFKSQFVSNSLQNLILNDSELRDLYNPEQIFDIVETSPRNDRNVVTPAEVGRIVDISINTTMGGTAGYEALSVGCRTCFIKSAYSLYDEILPDNILFNSIDEILFNINKISRCRNNLLTSNLGKYDINILS